MQLWESIAGREEYRGAENRADNSGQGRLALRGSRLTCFAVVEEKELSVLQSVEKPADFVYDGQKGSK